MNSHQYGAAIVKAAAGLLFAVLLISAAPTAFAQRPDDPRRDTQIWPDTTITIKLDRNFSLSLFGTVRLGRDDTALVSQQAGIGISRSFGKHFSSAFSYRYIENEPTPGRQSAEHRLFADFTPRTSLKYGVNVSDRNRIEWRDINEKISWRYRNRLQFERPFTIHQLRERRITPFIAGEALYDTRFRAWNRNQFYIGARLPIIKHVTFEGFYMKQWDARTKPGFLNVLGAYWRLDF
ncbi:MAG TPA: DUF2490 domain-containing protein [Blastocatellia bacterium]|nr:DUF2490 domain-containing protein [Blastocatellia bacterium]HMV86845.1 DUF2490 domain-containing protein [Blastocatellia bacterium]HMX25029.1 DUF2490 domain-containing protein [Blastocatellia bacterium]HMZ18747.1 DUF2490 domain-containing protein [Blastocatellia bacterium]HNG30824.1 DUF2490 domain-containing protein [Blastocatellia bacterium]